MRNPAIIAIGRATVCMAIAARSIATAAAAVCIALTLSTLKKRMSQAAMSKVDCDLIIVGTGLAGLSSALEAVATQPGIRIVMLDKAASIGGNSAKASSGINAHLSEADTSFTEDTIKSGGGRSNQELVKVLIDESADAIQFLTSRGVDLSVVSQLGGHSFARTSRNAKGPNIGFAIISALQKHVKALEKNIDLRLNAKVNRLEIPSSSSGGIRIGYSSPTGDVELTTRRAILATGGFAANRELIRSLAPALASLPTTNGPWASGDALSLVPGYVDRVDLDQIQIHPTGLVDPKDPEAQTKVLGPEALRGAGGILVNQEGKRFVNELLTRDRVVDAIKKQSGRTFLILGKEAIANFGPAMNFYVGRGLATKCTTPLEVAQRISSSGDSTESIKTNLIQTTKQYEQGRKAGVDVFGKTVFPTPLDLTDELVVLETVPVLHYCMGGLKVNASAQVLDKSGKVVPGLFAAGEVAGGVHGANRLAGNSLLECVVFGRIAGREAASDPVA